MSKLLLLRGVSMISVLIVDDEKLVRNTLKKFVPWKELGVEKIYEAEDGQKGLELTELHRPSIIITDIKMPHMNGMDFATRIRSFPWHSRLVFLSGYTDKEYLKGAIHLRVDGYIEKPLVPEEITELMRNLVEQCKQEVVQQNATVIFFRGKYSSEPLNPNVFSLSKQQIHIFGNALKQKDFKAAVDTLTELNNQMKQCESTPPDYIRSVFTQIAIQIESAAQLHGAKLTQSKSDDFIYSSSTIDRLSELESTAFRLVGSFFEEVMTDNADPIAQINQYLNKNYANCDLSVQKIAEHFNFNLAYLCTIYKQKTGRTINAALKEIRMETACKLLRETPLKLYEVGEKVGYRDGKYFAKVFTREVGLSPRRYRERHYEKT